MKACFSFCVCVLNFVCLSTHFINHNDIIITVIIIAEIITVIIITIIVIELHFPNELL